MWQLDIYGAFHICDGPRELQNPKIDSSRETQTFHSAFDESILFFSENAKLFHVFVVHLGIVGFLGALESDLAESSCSLDSVLDFERCFWFFLVLGKILDFDTRNPYE